MEKLKKISLNKVESNLPEDIVLAIVIAGDSVTGTQGQHHTGFVFQAGDGKLWLFDLAWHELCRYTPMEPGYAYVIEDFIDKYAATAIASFLANVHHVNKDNIKYSISWDNDSEYFDKTTGKNLKTGRGEGLTCATFVLEVLKRYGFDLLDIKTWPITAANSDWQKSIVDKLIESRPQSIDDFIVQFSKVGYTPRFLPEEVVGAAGYYDEEPLNFAIVSPASNEVLNELRRLCLDIPA